jgi:membrane associated rhomboid family serine protease
MIPLRDNQTGRYIPYVTFAIILLNVGIYLWDRGGNPFGQGVLFADLGMRPIDVKTALREGKPSFALVTLFTSLFLHANLLHLAANMLYLLTFGAGVEWAVGQWRYSLYYLFWGFAASAAHIFVDPNASIPTVGASGAIGGVLGAYFLLYPGNKIEIIIPFIPVPFEISAWILLGSWFLFQIFVRQEGVANWAHAGGFLAGMLTVLILGGPRKILAGRNPEEELDAY